MTITIHPARQPNDDVPPGTWEGTKQDAVMATAQLREIWERKKTGEKEKYGESEYDGQMATAQLRAYKLTKVILRRIRKNSTTEVPIMIEDIGFHADGEPDTEKTEAEAEVAAVASAVRPAQFPPPSAPLPLPPLPLKRRRPTSRVHFESAVSNPTSPIPLTYFPPPPPPPQKSSN